MRLKESDVGVDRPERVADIAYDRQGANPSWNWVLGLLVLADLAWIGIHAALSVTGRLGVYPAWSLNTEHGYPEFYQYSQEATAALLAIVLCLRVREPRLLAWAAIFLYILLDDSLAIHEAAGASLVNTLNLKSALGLRARDFGELIFFGGVAALLFGLLVACYFRGNERFRTITRRVAMYCGALVFFGMVVDSMHFLYELDWKFRLVAVIVEDGGEMVAMSFIAWYLIMLYRNSHIGFRGVQSVDQDRKPARLPPRNRIVV